MKQLTIIILSIITMIQATARERVIEFDSPRLKVYLPAGEVATGKAVVVCPGGGYGALAADYEGHDWAPWFNAHGIACAVLEYRLPQGDRTIPMDDATASFKILTDSAASWHINPMSIGIMGSSAGGHLASTMATHPNELCRPAFQILFYPVITLDIDNTDKGTRMRFLGDNPTEELVNEYSAQLNVTPATPKAFITLSGNDDIVPPINSLDYYNALVKAGVPAEMHIYPDGGHGWGYHSWFTWHTPMLDSLALWLARL